MKNLNSLGTKLNTTNINSDMKVKSKTENGTKIVMPGEENDKSVFLKMLAAQMSNQDPFNPQDPTQYVSQLAQFNVLEQTMNLNDSMKYVLGIGNGIMVNTAMNSATSLIGKNVEVQGILNESDKQNENSTGKVEGVNIKDGVVYMDVRIGETGELKSFEYSSLVKVN